jgi:BON domain
VNDVSPDDQYLLEHLRDALALDDRAHELDVDLMITSDAVVVSGTVATAERADRIAEVLGELAVGRTVRNDVTVLRLDPRPSEEQVG